MEYTRYSCYSNELLALSELIAEREARQLVVVQGIQISASVYLFVCSFVCNAQNRMKYLIQYAGVATHSMHGHIMDVNVILTITGHELLFIY